jgi:hypothetical protein
MTIGLLVLTLIKHKLIYEFTITSVTYEIIRSSLLYLTKFQCQWIK